MELPSPSQQEGDVVTKSTRGRNTVDRRSGDTKSTQERGHQVNPRGGDTKSTQERGHQVNRRRKGGDTKSIERGQLGGKRRAHNLLTREDDELSVDPKRRKTMNLYIKEREGKPNADCQSRSPMPGTNAEPSSSPWGQARPMRAGEAGGGRRGQWGPQATGHMPEPSSTEH